MHPITSRRVAAGGLTFAIDEAGSHSGDVALCLHGFPESRISWRHQLPALAALGWHAVAPDMRGYGESSRPRGTSAYRMDRLVEDVVALFEALGARRRLLIGHDWGALVAWSVAIRRAVPLDGLIILNVPHPAVFRRVLRTSWEQRLRSWYVGFFQVPLLPEALLTARRAALVARAISDTAARPGSFPRDVLDVYRANTLRPGAMTAMLDYYRANARDLLTGDGPSRPIAVPTLMIWGVKDTALSVELTTGYDALVDDFTLRLLPDASHWVQQDAPDAVNGLMGDWLADRSIVPAVIQT